jgi:SAM-dependent methyltransferase
VWIVGLDASFGMLHEARRGGRSGRYVQADAQRLPLPDGCVERVMANHMLYHVPDREQALREMRRVLRAGGRVVLTTNGADFGRSWRDLHTAVAERLGYRVDESVARRFTLDDLALVRRVFPSAEREVLAGDLVFGSAEPAMRYYASGMVDGIVDAPADGSHRAPLLQAMAEQIEAIIAAEGEFRVAKTVGWFWATV